jgi:hypothetical protein
MTDPKVGRGRLCTENAQFASVWPVLARHRSIGRRVNSLELDRHTESVHNRDMTGRMLTYLLSVLLPLSPLLCGHCAGSAECRPANSTCCSADSSASQGQCGVAEPRQCLPARHGAACERGTCRVHGESPRPVTPPTRQHPCRHQYCRSAICGQSAIVSRPVDWAADLAGHLLSLDEPINNALFGRALVMSFRAVNGSPPCGTPPCGSPVNVGPSGRAARIAYACWLI